jgi:molecular chaperone GrpE (heat shock protein)
MTTLNLKKHLIQRISEIEDTAFLEGIKTILDSKSQILHLITEQRVEIKQSQEQIKQGLFISQDQLDEEFEKWGLDKLSH